MALFNYVFAEGKQLAASRDVKFIETSSGIQVSLWLSDADVD